MSVEYEVRSKYVITRKLHKCFGCLESFPAGTEMLAQTNIGDGRIYTIYICDECEDFMTKNHDLCYDPSGFCYQEGCVRDARAEHQEALEGGGNDA